MCFARFDTPCLVAIEFPDAHVDALGVQGFHDEAPAV